MWPWSKIYREKCKEVEELKRQLHQSGCLSTNSHNSHYEEMRLIKEKFNIDYAKLDDETKILREQKNRLSDDIRGLRIELNEACSQVATLYTALNTKITK